MIKWAALAALLGGVFGVLVFPLAAQPWFIWAAGLVLPVAWAAKLWRYPVVVIGLVAGVVESIVLLPFIIRDALWMQRATSEQLMAELARHNITADVIRARTGMEPWQVPADALKRLLRQARQAKVFVGGEQAKETFGVHGGQGLLMGLLVMPLLRRVAPRRAEQLAGEFEASRRRQWQQRFGQQVAVPEHQLRGVGRLKGLRNLAEIAYSFVFSSFVPRYSALYGRAATTPFTADQAAGLVDRVFSEINLATGEWQTVRGADVPRSAIRTLQNSLANLLWRRAPFLIVLELWDRNVFLRGSLAILLRRLHLKVVGDIGGAFVTAYLSAYLNDNLLNLLLPVRVQALLTGLFGGFSGATGWLASLHPSTGRWHAMAAANVQRAASFTHGQFTLQASFSSFFTVLGLALEQSVSAAVRAPWLSQPWTALGRTFAPLAPSKLLRSWEGMMLVNSEVTAMVKGAETLDAGITGLAHLASIDLPASGTHETEARHLIEAMHGDQAHPLEAAHRAALESDQHVSAVEQRMLAAAEKASQGQADALTHAVNAVLAEAARPSYVLDAVNLMEDPHAGILGIGHVAGSLAESAATDVLGWQGREPGTPFSISGRAYEAFSDRAGELPMSAAERETVMDLRRSAEVRRFFEQELTRRNALALAALPEGEANAISPAGLAEMDRAIEERLRNDPAFFLG